MVWNRAAQVIFLPSPAPLDLRQIKLPPSILIEAKRGKRFFGLQELSLCR